MLGELQLCLSGDPLARGVEIAHAQSFARVLMGSYWQIARPADRQRDPCLIFERNMVY